MLVVNMLIWGGQFWESYRPHKKGVFLDASMKPLTDYDISTLLIDGKGPIEFLDEFNVTPLEYKLMYPERLVVSHGTEVRGWDSVLDRTEKFTFPQRKLDLLPLVQRLEMAMYVHRWNPIMEAQKIPPRLTFEVKI